MARFRCSAGDPFCPCQDGCACHYEGSTAWPRAAVVPPKLWSEREFGECCYPVDGVGPQTMVCAAPSEGAYCAVHKRQMVDEIAEAEGRKLMHDRQRIRHIRAMGMAAE